MKSLPLLPRILIANEHLPVPERLLRPAAEMFQG
jgi:hypothetical protein